MLPDTAKRNNGICMSCKRKGGKGKLGYILSIIVSFIFIAIGLWLFSNFQQVKDQGVRSSEWNSISGVVTKRFIRRSGGNAMSNLDSTTYYAIEYVYHVNGTKYTGDRICFGSNNDWASGNQQVDDDVTVYYDPKSPTSAVLECGYKKKEDEQIWFWFRTGFILIGIFGVLYNLNGMLRNSKKNKPSYDKIKNQK